MFIAYVILATLLINSSTRAENDNFFLHSDEIYRFNVLIPRDWNKRIINLNYKSIVILTKGRYTEIKITSTRPDLKENERWANWDEWYLNGIGVRLTRIVESKNVLIEKSMVGKILLFEYSSQNVRILQKVLIAKFDENLVTIECRAPVAQYQRHLKTFNTVMGSIRKKY